MCDLLEKFMTTYNSAGSEKNCVCVMECLSLFYLPTYLLCLVHTIKKQYKNEWEGKYLNTESVFSF